jgi:hypothetical protein
MSSRKRELLLAGAAGTFVGAGSLALVNGFNGDRPQHDAPPPPPSEEIRQQVEDKRTLVAALERIAAYKRYDERDYTEVWDMHDKASRESKRQHLGFVKVTAKVGDVVGTASDINRRMKGKSADISDLAVRFKENARDMMNYYVSGQGPQQIAMAEVPSEFWPEDRFQAARAQFDTFAKDVELANRLITTLKLDQPEQVKNAAGR